MLGSNRGFTLIETMLAIALLSMILGIAVPAVRQMIHSQQLRQATVDLGMALIRARQEAIMRKQAVIIDNQDGEWRSGWHVFVDGDGDGAFDTGELVLKTSDPIANGVRIAGNTHVRRYVRYTPTGDAKMANGAFQAGTITLCHNDGQQQVRQLVLSATGRLRTVKEAAGSC